MCVINSIEELDWNEMWKHAKLNSSWRKRHKDTIAFWDTRAGRYDNAIKCSNSADIATRKLDIDSECTVLDIGAGTGRLTIPLAQTVKKVTAIEPSKGMLKYLKEDMSKEGLTNITCINKRWEDVSAEEIDIHDIVIASHSLSMLDIIGALSKMNDLAKRQVYLFAFAGNRANYGELWPKLYGEEYRPGPDYIYLYNVLYSMSIYANVESYKQESMHRFSSLDDAVEYFGEIFGDVPVSRREEELRAYLSEKLIEEDESLCLKHESKNAMIWWKRNK